MRKIILSREEIYKGTLILVNRQHPFYEKAEERFLVPVNGMEDGVLLDRRAVNLLAKLMNGLKGGWEKIVPVSGWRSLKEQKEIYENSLRENGSEFTAKYVAVPGYSEHQSGLAIDLGLREEEPDPIRPGFPYSGICQEFRNKAADFGFIERYPYGKEGITGIGHEPWHFRYVGAPHGAIMTEKGWTLEEYLDFLQEFPYGSRAFLWQKEYLQIAVSYVEASPGEETQIEVEEEVPYKVSGDNRGGYILTEWRMGNGK